MDILNETVQNSSSVVCLDLTGTSSFVISGATCRSVLGLPIDLPFSYLNGSKLQHLQHNLNRIKMITVDEI